MLKFFYMTTLLERKIYTLIQSIRVIAVFLSCNENNFWRKNVESQRRQI